MEIFKCNNVFKWDFQFDQSFPGKSVEKNLEIADKIKWQNQMNSCQLDLKFHFFILFAMHYRGKKYQWTFGHYW